LKSHRGVPGPGARIDKQAEFTGTLQFQKQRTNLRLQLLQRRLVTNS
jgi:hypothetical protein